MDLRDAIQKGGQILDQERVEPTISYETTRTAPEVAAILASVLLTNERGSQHPRPVRENPGNFQFKSENFDLLCAILDQVSEQDRPVLIGSLNSRISNCAVIPYSFKRIIHKFRPDYLGRLTNGKTLVLEGKAQNDHHQQTTPA